MEGGKFLVTRDGSKVTISIEFPVGVLAKPVEPLLKEKSKEDPLVFIKDAPTIALVSVSTLRRMIKGGEISFTKIRSRIFFRESVLLGIRQDLRMNGKSI